MLSVFRTLVLFCGLFSTALSVGPLRDAYVVQVIPIDDFAAASDAWAANPESYNGRIKAMTTEIYLTGSEDGRVPPVSIKPYLQPANGGFNIGPAYTVYDNMDSFNSRIVSGPTNNGLYRSAIHLGSMRIDNLPFFRETTVNGVVYSEGELTTLWNSFLDDPEIRDPYLNDYMRLIYGYATTNFRGGVRPLQTPFHGFAGFLQDLYERNVPRADKLHYSPNLRRIQGSTIEIDTKASAQYFSEHYQRQRAISRAIAEERAAARERPLTLDNVFDPVTESGFFADSDGDSPPSAFDEPPCDSAFGKGPVRKRDCRRISDEDKAKLRGPTSSVETRIGGTLRTFTSIGGRVAGLAGAAGLALLPAFIIMDLVEGDWKAAVWAVGAAAAGIAADVVVAAIFGATLAAGPVGIVVTAFEALFFIIPGLFTKKKSPPSNNPAKIVQYAFFGDPDHTGNEKCNENLRNNGQTPNCTVTYGAAAIASLLGWTEIYDGSVFTIDRNQGRSMSIIDIAASFVVYDYAKPNATNGAPYVIDCGEKKCDDPHDPGNRYPSRGPTQKKQIPCPVSSGYDCSNAKFKINRDLINLPILNRTATSVHGDAQSGECKIVSDPVEGEILYPPNESGQYAGPSGAFPLLPYFIGSNSTGSNSTNSSSTDTTTTYPNSTSLDYNSTGAVTNVSLLTGPWSLVPAGPVNYTGKPVSIACGLTRSIPDVLSPDYNISRPNVTTHSNQSTSGDASYFIPPPRPQPFLPLTSENATCLSSSTKPDSKVCLPNGTFPANQGAFGFKGSDIDSLSFPGGTGDIDFNIEQMQNSEGVDETPDLGWDRNLIKDDNFQYTMTLATQKRNTFIISTRPSPSTFCVFSQPNFLGDAFCMGVGGTNFSSNLVNKVASLTLSPGLAGWLYPGFYGNPLGLEISTSVADLTNLPFHTTESFKNNVAAAWIYAANHTAVK